LHKIIPAKYNLETQRKYMVWKTEAQKIEKAEKNSRGASYTGMLSSLYWQIDSDVSG
jgi:hypothetical protein